MASNDPASGAQEPVNLETLRPDVQVRTVVTSGGQRLTVLELQHNLAEAALDNKQRREQEVIDNEQRRRQDVATFRVVLLLGAIILGLSLLIVISKAIP